MVLERGGGGGGGDFSLIWLGFTIEEGEAIFGSQLFKQGEGEREKRRREKKKEKGIREEENPGLEL